MRLLAEGNKHQKANIKNNPTPNVNRKENDHGNIENAKEDLQILLVTNLKVLALAAKPAVSRNHENATVGACILQMDHNKIFLHRRYSFTKLRK